MVEYTLEGSVAEWLKAPHSKCGMGVTPSEVRILPLPQCWWGGRVVYGGSLENYYTGNRIEGSNPSPTADEMVYTGAMSNVLDLKNIGAARDERISTADVSSPAETVAPIELSSVPSTEPEIEAERLEAAEQEELMDVEDVAEAALAASGLPVAVSWEAHHPLQGGALRKHYMILGSLTAFGVLMAVWQGNIIPFVVMFFAAITLGLRERWSRPVSVSIDETGVTVDGQEYAHTAFASFHIHRMPDETHELSLRAQQRLLPHLRLPLGEQDPYEVHAVLTQYIPEGKHKIPLVEYLLRKQG